MLCKPAFIIEWTRPGKNRFAVRVHEATAFDAGNGLPLASSDQTVRDSSDHGIQQNSHDTYYNFQRPYPVQTNIAASLWPIHPNAELEGHHRAVAATDDHDHCEEESQQAYKHIKSGEGCNG